MEPIITARALTDLGLMKEVLEFAYGIEESKMTKELAYFREHSTIRTQLYLIKMKDIMTKTSVHLVRHAATGQFHLVGSNRGDWNVQQRDQMSDIEWDESINRRSPVNHVMILNAGHLIDISKKRLCSKAEAPTRKVWGQVRDAISQVDPWLASSMVPTCYYRNGICPEPNPCGNSIKLISDIISQVPEEIYRNARNHKAVGEATGKQTTIH